MLAELGLGALIALSAVVAAVSGGWRERTAVGLFAAVSGAWMLTPADPRAHAAVWELMALDLAVLLVLGRIAWKSPRNWPVWAMAPQAVAAAASLAFALQPDVGAETYLRALMLTRYGAVLALLIGMRRPASHP